MNTDLVDTQQRPTMLTLVFSDWSWNVDRPEGERECLAWRCRYAPESIAPKDLLIVASLLNQLSDLTQDGTTKDAIAKLRIVRRALAEASP